MHNRRDFLKFLGLAVGASLSGCGSSSQEFFGEGGGTPVANAYRFVPLASSGQALPNKLAILAQATNDDLPFMGGVMINDLRSWRRCIESNCVRDVADSGEPSSERIS